MAQKNFYYIGVMDSEEGMKFVTSFDKQSKMAIWDKNKKPLALTQQTAKDYAEALAFNLVPATVVRTFWELDNQPCWVMTEDEKNIDKLSSLIADVLKNVDLGVANKWKDNGLTAYVNLDTDKIRVIGDSHYRPRLDKDIVQFVPSERDNDTGEVTAYDIYPCPPMWQLFKDTQENRELLVEQLENKTGKRFAFAKPTERKRDRQLMRSDSIENVNEPQRNEILELKPSNTPDYYELLDGEGADLDLTLAEELAKYAYETACSWTHERQKEANMSLEINDMGYSLNITREWGLTNENLRKVIDKAEEIYNNEYADEELDLTQGNGRSR